MGTTLAVFPTRLLIRRGGSNPEQEHRLRLIQRRVRVAMIALFLLGYGFGLRRFGQFWSDLVCAYLIVTGAQIILTALGIRSELFSNNPSE
jgi:hypothetical protein